MIAYFTDVEGRWDKLAGFCEGNPLVTLANDELRVADGAIFVFGGDAIDRGPAGRKIVAALTTLKRRQPAQVVLLAGNRDINKMRLRRELTGHPPPKAPEGLAPGMLLRWIFANTMGAAAAFAHRANELGGASDEAVVASYLTDVERDGPLTEYLALCQLAFRSGETLFVHGAVTEESFGIVPGATQTHADVDRWIAALNEFYSREVSAFREGADESAYLTLIDYQRPVRGTHLNQASVVYGRLADEEANPFLPPAPVIANLQRSGIRRLIVGHTPSGDTPSVLRDPESGFELLMADNSYSRLEAGSQVRVDGESLAARAVAALDGGARANVHVETILGEDSSPLGLRDMSTGELVKGRIGDDNLLLFRGLPAFEVQQRADSSANVARRNLVPPHRP